MTFRDLQARLRSLLGGRDTGSSRRPDGGTSCYRPVQRRNRQEEKLAREKAAEYAQGQPQIPSVHTGFTGMNPPTGYMPAQNGGFSDPRGFGATRTGFDGTGGYTGFAGAAGNTGYAGAAGNTGYAGYGFRGNPGPGAPSDNISYMPGVYPETGNSFTHVEHIMAITSLRSCYDAIECMKNGETLIVTLDVLGNDSESVRCQDMLAGAAFTLRCTVRSLSSLGVVIIAPEGVKILPEQQIRRYEDTGFYQAPVNDRPIGESAPRRERRVSQNPMGWNSPDLAASQGVNPYTGSLPAAAGAYGAYGGY